MYSLFCHAVIVVYNVSSRPSFFNAINKWYYTFKKKKRGTANMFLVGNIIDGSPTKRCISREEAKVCIVV